MLESARPVLPIQRISLIYKCVIDQFIINFDAWFCKILVNKYYVIQSINTYQLFKYLLLIVPLILQFPVPL